MTTPLSTFLQAILSEARSAFLEEATPVEGAPEFDCALSARDHFEEKFMGNLSKRLGVLSPLASDTPLPPAKRAKVVKPKAKKPDAAVDALADKVGELAIGAGAAPPAKANMAKVSPACKKALKTRAAEFDSVVNQDTENELLVYLNGLTVAEFKAKKKAEEHVPDFYAWLRAKDKGPTETIRTGCVPVEFKGKNYYVDAEGQVYVGEGKQDDAGQWTSYKGIGVVGVNDFADMELPEDA
jgi:hypothetical protein